MTGNKHEELKKKVSDSHKKIKSVLQFMEESEGSIAELMDSTEEKIKKSKKNGKVDGQSFSKAESETLQVLFDKMKEEVVFNEFTKNVLDQKDSSATKKAKKEMYASHVNYLESQRDVLLYDADTIANQYSSYGVDSTHVESMIKGDSISDTISSLMDNIGSEKMDSIIENNKKTVAKGIDFEGGKKFSELESGKQKTIKDNLSEYLNKELTNEIKSAKAAQQNYETAQRSYEAAKKKAALTGKIDIFEQLKSLK